MWRSTEEAGSALSFIPGTAAPRPPTAEPACGLPPATAPTVPSTEMRTARPRTIIAGRSDGVRRREGRAGSGAGEPAGSGTTTPPRVPAGVGMPEKAPQVDDRRRESLLREPLPGTLGVVGRPREGPRPAGGADVADGDVQVEVPTAPAAPAAAAQATVR